MLVRREAAAGCFRTCGYKPRLCTHLGPVVQAVQLVVQIETKEVSVSIETDKAALCLRLISFMPQGPVFALCKSEFLISRIRSDTDNSFRLSSLRD